MKKTIRILSLVLCLAMLVGVFAASAFAAEEATVLMDEKFNDQVAPNTGKWSGDVHANAFTWVPTAAGNPENQHVKLTHNNATDGTRVYIGYVNDPANGIAFERGKIAAKDLTFEAKVEDGTDMKIEFYVKWDLYKADGGTEVVPRRVTIDVKDGKIYNGTTEVGAIPTTVDITEWNTWTVRLSRASGYSGDYNVQVMINGIDYVTSQFLMGTQGSNPQERFAIHARSVGSIEIDNVKLDDLYLDAAKGAVDGEVTNLWKTGFGALGTELTYDDTDNSYTAGQWKRGIHENTSITMVEDAAGAEATGGYLKAAFSSTNTRYCNQIMADILPVDEKFWVELDVKLEGNEEIAFQIGTAMTDKGNASGRQLYVDFRPDGLYYNDGSAWQKADFAIPALTDWTSFIFECDPQAQEVTVYTGGNALGKIYFRNLAYSATSSNFTQFKIVTHGSTSVDLSGGAAYMDNIKVSYGVSPIQQPQNPGNTADASIIGLAAMMLPVSGIGLGALSLKRKKEN